MTPAASPDEFLDVAPEGEPLPVPGPPPGAVASDAAVPAAATVAGVPSIAAAPGGTVAHGVPAPPRTAPAAVVPAAASPSRPRTRCVVVRHDGASEPLHDLSAISDRLGDTKLVWLDVVNPTAADFATLQEEFALHHLAIEDAASRHQLPKIEAYDDYWFLVVHGITRDGETLTVHEIAAFVGERFVVTVRDDPVFPIEAVERRWRGDERGAPHTSGTLLYYLLDAVVDGYTAVGDVLTEHVGRLEDRLFSGRRSNVFREIYEMKKQSMRFRRSVAPMREILLTIARANERLGRGERAELRDVGDHVQRVLEQIDGARDLLGSALDIHFGYNTQQQNEVSKQLTIVATIFLPLTYITGFFGQNFGFLVDHIKDVPAFWALGVGAELFSVIALLAWFRSRRWI